MKKNFIILFLFLSAFSLTVFSQSQEKPRGITVTGVGVVTVIPTRAEIRVSVSASAELATAALDSNNRLMKKVIGVLKQEGVVDTNLVTSNFLVSPQNNTYSTDSKIPWKHYYTASMTLEVRVSEIEKVGRFIDKAVSAGAVSISNPVFSVVSEESLKAEAYTRAVKDAEGKAQKLAGSFGVKLGKPNTISVDMYDVKPREYYYYQIYGVTSSEDRVVGTTILPNLVTKQVTVNVTFDIVSPEKKK